MQFYRRSRATSSRRRAYSLLVIEIHLQNELGARILRRERIIDTTLYGYRAPPPTNHSEK